MKMTPEQIARCEAATVKIRKVLVSGDLVTHTRCCGFLEEHVFTGWSGSWISGRATRETMKVFPGTGRFADDIAAVNVTHVNRAPVDGF